MWNIRDLSAHEFQIGILLDKGSLQKSNGCSSDMWTRSFRILLLEH